jgi:glycosyltransferase involved in cell wall biosynthesis
VVKPLVTIGVAVYNEERFLDAALTSLRAQDYPNLEIVISDNASTDATPEICAKHAADDDRIRLERQNTNIGAIANFRHVADVAEGTYFMWGSGHDVWSPGLVSECVALLEADAGAVLAFPTSMWIGPDDEPWPRDVGWTDMRGLDPVARFFTVLWGSMHPVMGVIRTHDLRACEPFPDILGGDLVLLAELALRGGFLHAPGSRWMRREFRQEASYRKRLERYTSAEDDVPRTNRGAFASLLQIPAGLVRVLMRSSLRPIDKITSLIALIAALPVRYVVGRRGPTS